MSKKARNRKALHRGLKRLAKIVVKVFELPTTPLEFLTKDVINKDVVKEIYEWKLNGKKLIK